MLWYHWKIGQKMRGGLKRSGGGKDLARMGVQAWQIMVCAHREENDVQEEEQHLQILPTPREKSMCLLISSSVGKGLNPHYWPESLFQFLKMMWKQVNIFFTLELDTGSTEKTYWIFKNYFFNTQLLVFKSLPHQMQRLCCARVCSENRRCSSARILICPKDKNILMADEKVGEELFQREDGIIEAQGILILWICLMAHKENILLKYVYFPCGKSTSTDEDIETRSTQGRKVYWWRRKLFMSSS